MKRIIIVCMALALSAAALFFIKSKSQPIGTVIILNGPSAAGKSSIQKEFQNLTMAQGDLWIKLGIDNLFDKPMPDITMENLAYWQSPNPIRWVESTNDEHGNLIITLLIGEQGEKVARGMNSAIAAYAKAGNNIIVDYIAYKKEWIDDLRAKLKGIPTYWVKVEIPLEVLEAREIARGTSPKGHARSHYNTVHWDIKYDLVVNSDKDSAIEIAKQIKNALEQKYMTTQEKNIPENFDEIMKINIKQLSADQWQQFREIRLAALKTDPKAFGGTYEEELHLSEDQWRALIANMWFALIDNKVVGMIGMLRDSGQAGKHRAHVISLWVNPENRGQAIGKQLIQHLQNFALTNEIRKLYLHVTTTQTSAVQLYESLEFEKVGLLKNNTKSGASYFDQYLMEWHVRDQI